MQGKRYNKGKAKWGLVDFDSLLPLVDVLEYGANKYSAFNWQKGLPYTEVVESLLRHTFSFLKGNDLDAESGLSHVGHILCNAMFLSYMYRNRKELDDRHITDNISDNVTECQ